MREVKRQMTESRRAKLLSSHRRLEGRGGLPPVRCPESLSWFERAETSPTPTPPAPEHLKDLQLNVLAGQLSILGSQLSVLEGLQNILAGPLSILIDLQSILIDLQSILIDLQSILAGLLSVIASLLSILGGQLSVRLRPVDLE